MYSYLWIFFLFGFLGWLGEVLYAASRERRLVNRGFLLGPLCPIYGVGVVLIDFVLRPVGYSVPALLVGSLVIASALEMAAGWLLERIFHHKWWDYSDTPHNFRGYVSLRFALLWAVLGAVSVRMGLPAARWLIAQIPRPLGWWILLGLAVLLLADFIVCTVAIFGLNGKLREGATSQELKKNPLYRRLLRAFPALREMEHNTQLGALADNVAYLKEKSLLVMKRRDELTRQCYEQTLAPGEERPFAYGLCWPKMFWVFMIGSFIGFFCETIYALAVPPHVLEPRVSFVFGPLISVYGLGAMAITLFLHRMYDQKDILIFLASMVLGAAFEYVCSFVQQASFGTVSWEYSGSTLNIGGRTNLMYSFFWGILGLLWVKDIYPFLSRMVQRMPKKLAHPLTTVTAVLLALDVFLTIGALYRQSERVNDVPADNALRVFFDQAFPDDYLHFIYPHMEYLGKPEIVHEPPLPPFQD